MSYKKLYGIKRILLAFVGIYKGLGCIEAGRVPHIDYGYCEALSKGNPLIKIDRN